MGKIKLVIFDLDGTLVDAYPAITSSFNYTMRKLGYCEQDKLAIRKQVGWGDESLLKPFIKIKDLKRALSLYRKHHSIALTRKSRLFAGVKKLLGYLKKKDYILAVASNRPTRFSLILIRHLGLAEYFDYVLCADRLRHGKPNPEIIIKIMRKFSIKPQATLYVGDMAIDVQAGRRAKVNTAVVSTGSSSIRELRRANPDYVIGEIGQLHNLL